MEEIDTTNLEKEPENRIIEGRNPDGTFAKGFTGNPGGRKKNPLKEFGMKMFESWSDAEKLEFLQKMNPIDVWKMIEGNPKQDTDVTSDGQALNVIVPAQVAEAFKINGTNPETIGGNTE